MVNDPRNTNFASLVTKTGVTDFFFFFPGQNSTGSLHLCYSFPFFFNFFPFLTVLLFKFYFTSSPSLSLHCSFSSPYLSPRFLPCPILFSPVLPNPVLSFLLRLLSSSLRLLSSLLLSCKHKTDTVATAVAALSLVLTVGVQSKYWPARPPGGRSGQHLRSWWCRGGKGRGVEATVVVMVVVMVDDGGSRCDGGGGDGGGGYVMPSGVRSHEKGIFMMQKLYVPVHKPPFRSGR